MKQHINTFNILITILFSLSIVFASTFARKLDHLFISRKVNKFLNEAKFQGAVLIAKNGDILLSKGYGLANQEHQIPNTPQTIFRIGSITKQLTAIAILQLHEKGKLQISDSLSKYLSDYPRGDQISIHHLLSHTSGIPSITDFPNLQDIQRQPSTVYQVVDHFKYFPLKFQPGTNCEYSDSGYILLGAIIEIASGKSYQQFIQDKLLTPLQMRSTFPDHLNVIIPNKASGYAKGENEKIIHANYIDMTFPHGAGELASSVEDLYRLDRMIKEKKLLSQTSIDLLLTIQGKSTENNISYGYGFFIGPENDELEAAAPTIVGHYGTIEGFRAASFRYLDDDLSIILLSNLENTDINGLHIAIAHIVRSYWRGSATH